MPTKTDAAQIAAELETLARRAQEALGRAHQRLAQRPEPEALRLADALGHAHQKARALQGEASGLAAATRAQGEDSCP